MNVRIKLSDARSRRMAFRELSKIVLDDVANGRIPTYHILHVKHSEVDNHYMTPMSFEPADESGSKAVWAGDFMFFLRLLLSLKKVVEVEYDSKRPAVIFTYVDVRNE